MSRIPITIVATPVTTPVRAVDINQLLEIIAAQLAGEVDGSFAGLPQGNTNPSYDQGLFYNTAQKLFYVWSQDQGKYIPMVVGPRLGDTKLTYVAGDELALGFVKLDGRAPANVTGASASQVANLTTLFGATLPTQANLGTAVYKVFCGYP